MAREPAPRAVWIAAWLMLAGVAAGVASAVISVVGGAAVVDEFIRRAPATGAQPSVIAEMVRGMRVGFYGGAGLALMFSAAIGLLIVPIRRGIRAARTATWILVGLSACCGGLGLVTTFQRNPPNLYQLQYGTGDPTERRLNQALADSVPAWSAIGSTAATLLQVLAYTAVIVLLALPPANEFFRRRPLGAVGTSPATR